MVDDGSTDGEPRDRRALRRARPRASASSRSPTAAWAARATRASRIAGGEFLAFVDGDDVVPDDAYARLLGSLDRTGLGLRDRQRPAPHAPGHVAGAVPRPDLRARPRRAPTSRGCRPLLADRTAWNKLFRRSFWDAHGFRFPEGVVHEDIPVTLPAHLAARSVDVLAAPVYRWRLREDGARSITQRRLEHRVLRRPADRGREGHGALPRPRHGDALALVRVQPRRRRPAAPPRTCSTRPTTAYRALFLTRVNALLDGASPRIFAPLPAIDRLKWRLVRLELRRRAGRAAAVREGGRDAGADPCARRGRYRGDVRADAGGPRVDLPARPPRRGAGAHGRARRDRARRRRRAAPRPRLRQRARRGRPGGTGARDRRAPARRRCAPRGCGWPPGGCRPRRCGAATSARAARGPGFEARLDPARAAPAAAGICSRTARAGGLRRRRGRFALGSPALIGALDVHGGATARRSGWW